MVMLANSSTLCLLTGKIILSCLIITAKAAPLAVFAIWRAAAILLCRAWMDWLCIRPMIRLFFMCCHLTPSALFLCFLPLSPASDVGRVRLLVS